MPEQRVLGIDGGGTRVRAVVLSSTRGILAAAEAGPANIREVGLAVAGAEIFRAASDALLSSGASFETLDAIWAGLAGVRTDDESAEVIEFLKADGRFGRTLIGVGSDVEAAAAGGLALQPGMVLVGGTGSSCWGRGRDGQTTVAGGQGPLLDDGGSAYDLGRQLLMRAIRVSDGRLPAWAGTSLVWEKLGLSSASGLRGLDLNQKTLASLAIITTELADRGDPPACEILAKGAGDLAQMVGAVYRQLRLESPLLIMAGGLLAGAPSYRELVERNIAELPAKIVIQNPEFSPELGSAFLALRNLDADFDLAPTLTALRDNRCD